MDTKDKHHQMTISLRPSGPIRVKLNPIHPALPAFSHPVTICDIDIAKNKVSYFFTHEGQKKDWSLFRPKPTVHQCHIEELYFESGGGRFFFRPDGYTLLCPECPACGGTGRQKKR